MVRRPIAKKTTARKSAPAAKPAPAKAAPTKTAPVKSAPAPKVDKSAEIGAQAVAILKRLHDVFVEINAFAANGGFDFAVNVPATAKVEPKSAAEVDEKFDKDEVSSYAIKELRELAVRLGLEEQKLKSGILEELEEKGYFVPSEEDDEEESEELDEEEELDDEEDEDDASEDDSDDEEDEEEEEGDDEDEEDGEELTREDLEDMDIKELRALAKEEGHKLSEYRGLDQEGLISLILGEDDEEEDAEDDEDEDGEEEVLDEDQLREMPLDELKTIAKELGVKVPARIKQPQLVELILNSAEDDE